MPCLSPVHGYQARLGGFTTSKTQAFEDKPMQVPCGSCLDCRMEHARQWAVRCMHEASCHERNCFVTLTYDNENLPANMSVNVRVWQLFAKKLRKRLGRFRFFHCGEYGDLRNRPHYHALIFGQDFGDKKFWKMSKSGEPLYTSKMLSDTWGLGFCSVGSVSFQSARYVASYVNKKIKTSGKFSRVNYDYRSQKYLEVENEYGTMSRGEGIGAKWCDRWGDDTYPRDELIIDGKAIKPPRYYDERRAAAKNECSDLSTEMSQVKGKRRKAAKRRCSDVTPERLKAREKILKSKQQLYRRDFD